MERIFTLLVVIWLSLFCISIATAQTITLPATEAESLIELDNPTSKAAVRELVSKLSDNSVRELLIQRLDAVAEANKNTAAEAQSAMALFQTGVRGWQENGTRALTHIERVAPVLSKIGVAVRESVHPMAGSRLWLAAFFAILVGLLVERLIALFFGKRKRELIAAFSTTLWGILKILYTRLSLDVIGVLGFSIASHFFLNHFVNHESLGYLFASMLLKTIVGGWLAYVVCRFFFAPRRPDLRICNTTDQRAMNLTVSFSLLAAFIVLVHKLYELMLATGIDNLGGWDQTGPLAFLLNISMYIAAVGVIWLNRSALTEILSENKKRIYLAIGAEAPLQPGWFSQNWPKIAIALLIFQYVLVEIVTGVSNVAVYSRTAVYISFITIFLWPGIDANVSLFVGKGVQTSEDESEDVGKARRNMQQGLLRVGRVIVVCVVLYALAALWGVNLLSLAEAGLGTRLAGNFIELVLIALFAYVAWELVSIVCDRWLASEGGASEEHEEEPGGGDAGGVGLSRVATLLPIIKRTAQFLIVVVSVIMVLNNWGVNIGPLLAGAGVVGLAIGFGAQTLVKDIVSGMFFLADDAFRVGEYIDVGGTMGNVEKISLRSLRLRHHRGLVHTIPYGEIPKLTNFSRDWVIMKLRFRVPFDTDVNKVKKIFKGIGQDMLEHPELGEDFLQPFKSQGVAEVDDNGIVVRGKFMAKPGKQFMIRKELYVRVQKAFDEAGIPFARKQVMVHIPGLEKKETLEKDDYEAISAAAAESVEDIDLDAIPPKPV